MIQCHNLNEWKAYISIWMHHTIRQTLSFRNNTVHTLIHSLDYYCFIYSVELQGDFSFLYYFFFFSYSFLGARASLKIFKIMLSKVNVQGRHSRVFIHCAARATSCSKAWIISAVHVSPEIKTGCKRTKKNFHALLLYQMANRVLLIWKRINEAFYTRMAPLR